MKAVMEEMSDEKESKHTTFITTTWELAKAHRRVEVAEEDWGLQACAVDPEDDEILLNTCGTYGIGCASYYWGRLGAMVTRGQHYILGYDLMA